MDAQTQITLDEYYVAAVADIRAAFPQFVTVEFDREDRELKADDLPACLLEIDEFEDAPDRDPQTEQWATMARVNARVVLGFRTGAVKMEVRKAATSLAVWMRKRRFRHPTKPGEALPTGAAEVAGCYRDDFSPELDQFEVWRLEWLQIMHLGATAFPAGGTVPTNPVFSWAPAIGYGHEQDYSELPIPEAYDFSARSGGTDELAPQLDAFNETIRRMGRT